MLSFEDIFKKSFLENYNTNIFSGSGGVEITGIISTLIFTVLIAIYIFYCYRLLTRRVFYSKNFNISLISIAVITAAIILTIQVSVVVSLGMVGALSIVRFRTAIKDPFDLMFLFWSISVGIICGAGLVTIAILLSIINTLVIFIFDKLPIARAPMILVINAESTDGMNKSIDETISHYTKFYQEKSRSISNGQLDLVIEIRVENGVELTEKLSSIDKIYSVSLMKHDGEVTF